MSPPRLAVPPGRVGRLWLIRRLAVARRGADLLDRKLQVLQLELDRRRGAAARAAAEWERRQADADSWLLRAALLGGERAIRLAAAPAAAEVTISDAATMGVRYPVGATCIIPPPVARDGPALAAAREAHRAALVAAVQHAAAAEALRVLEAETVATRYRLRAVRDRWIPRLEQALAEVTFAIEELERADAARLRLAATARHRPSPAGLPSASRPGSELALAGVLRGSGSAPVPPQGRRPRLERGAVQDQAQGPAGMGRGEPDRRPAPVGHPEQHRA